MEGQLLSAADGVGPLFQRDYWAVFAECPTGPSDVIAYVREHFCELPPPSIVQFIAESGIAKGAELDIRIAPGQQCFVRVIDEGPQSFTLGTLAGHPEAGRITFGSYRNSKGDVIFHIRSRARSSSLLNLIGFVAIGDAMQTNTWTDFITNTAAAVGARIQDVIHADTRVAEPGPDDEGPLESPTFLAVGD